MHLATLYHAAVLRFRREVGHTEGKRKEGRKEGRMSIKKRERRWKKGYMAADILVKDHSDSEREEICCHHYMGYSF